LLTPGNLSARPARTSQEFAGADFMEKALKIADTYDDEVDNA